MLIATEALVVGAPREVALDLAWLDGVVRDAVEAQRLGGAELALPGIYVSEAEVDGLLDLSALCEEAAAGPQLPQVWAGRRLGALKERCSLTAFDVAVLLLALAPQLDRRYGRLYAYLQDDLTKPFATPGLALDLFGASFVGPGEERARV